MFGRTRTPSLGGATGWLNSEPLGPAELRGGFVTVTDPPKEETHMSVMTKEPAEVTAIRPFTIETRDADLDDLRARIAAHVLSASIRGDPVPTLA